MSVTRLTKMREGLPVGSATGFFYSTQTDRHFLVTNRHVICGKPGEHPPDAIAAEMHIDSRNSSRTNELSVPLFDVNDEPTWIEHQALGANADIAVVEISSLLRATDVFQSVTKQNFLPLNLTKLNLGADVMVLGFPQGFYDDVHKLPILKGGTVASAFPIQFRRQPYFLINAEMDEGSSGSPVFTKPNDTWQTNEGLTVHLNTEVFYFLGVVAASVPESIGPDRGQSRMNLAHVYYWWLLGDLVGEPIGADEQTPS